MKRFILLASILVFITGCTIEKKDVVGTYVAQNLNNNIDTLKIFENGIYIKKLYRKTDSSLIYINTGKWKYIDERITMENFFPDEDELYSPEAGDFENILITSSLNINRRLNKIVIYYMQITDNKYYEKL